LIESPATASFVAAVVPRAAASSERKEVRGFRRWPGSLQAAPGAKSSPGLNDWGRGTAPPRLLGRLTGLDEDTIRPTTLLASRQNDWPFLIPGRNLLGQLQPAPSAWSGLVRGQPLWPLAAMSEGSHLRALRRCHPRRSQHVAAIAASVGASFFDALIEATTACGSPGVVGSPFSVTADLTACFRRRHCRAPGWDGVACLIASRWPSMRPARRCNPAAGPCWMDPGRPPRGIPKFAQAAFPPSGQIRSHLTAGRLHSAATPLVAGSGQTNGLLLLHPRPSDSCPSQRFSASFAGDASGGPGRCGPARTRRLLRPAWPWGARSAGLVGAVVGVPWRRSQPFSQGHSWPGGVPLGERNRDYKRLY